MNNDLKRSTSDDEYYINTLFIVFHDYAGCRCAFRNLCIMSGFILAEQCVEKLLKAWIYVKSGEVKKIKGQDPHCLEALADRSMNFDSGPIDFSKWRPLLGKLTDSFNGKYADGKKSGKRDSKSSRELDSIDELVCKLLSALPARNGFLTEFELVAAEVISPEIHWIVSENKYFGDVLEGSRSELGDFVMMHIEKSIMFRLG